MQEISANPSIEADVVVVGAGFAGIMAARELKHAGLSVALLEARARLGGRSLSRPIGDGKVVELGCEFHGQDDTLGARTARSVGIGSHKVYDQGHRLLDDGSKLIRWKGRLPGLSPGTLADFAQAALRLERMQRQVPEEQPWAAAHARQWDSQTMWSWMQRNLRTKGARSVMRVMIEAGMGTSPADVSLLHVLNYSKGVGGFRAMTTVTGGALENRFDGGSHAFALRLAEAVAAETYVRAEVRRIAQSGDRVRVSGTGFEAVGRRVVVAVPVPLVGRIDFDPILPAYRAQATQRMTMGSVIKYLALYDEPFWRADGLTGQAISPDGPVRAVLDSCPPDGTPGVLAVFVAGPSARTMGRLTAGERREQVLRELVRFFGPRAGRPYDLIEQNWMAEQFTRGCYHGYTPPGFYTEYGPALTQSIGRIHWAGAESVPVEYGAMSGALFSGKRVAAEILARDAGEDRRDSVPAAAEVPVS